jgi:hypothetical protein
MVKPDGDDVLSTVHPLIDELNILMAACAILVGNHNALLFVVFLKKLDQFSDCHD